MKIYIFLFLLIAAFTSNAQLISNVTHLDERVPIKKITTAFMLGNSIMDGNLASPTSNSFRSKLITKYGWTQTNLSLGGSGVWREIFNFRNQTYTRSLTAVFEEGGLNDIRRSNSSQTFNKIESVLNTLLQKHYSVSSVASGSSSVTRAGTFSAFDCGLYGGYSGSAAIPGNTGSFNTTVNATWTYTFTGVAIAVTFSAADPTISRGNAEIRIDGVLVETITDFSQRYDAVSDGVNDNKRGPDTRVYFGLTNASHTIEVKGITATVVVDQFAVLSPTVNIGIFFCIEIPKILDYIKPGIDQGSDAYIDQANTLRRTIVNKWRSYGFRAHYVPVMNYYQLIPGNTIDATDSVHPLNNGHFQIFQGNVVRIR